MSSFFDSLNLEIEISLVENEPSYDPIMYEELPEEYRTVLDKMATELIDPDSGRIMVIGSSRVGKTFLINQLVGNMDRYLSKLGREYFHFVRLTRDIIATFAKLPNGYQTFISKVCEHLRSSEYNICFVTGDVEAAGFIASQSSKPRIILEATDYTFERIVKSEREGQVNIWGSWDTFHANYIYNTKNETIDLLEKMLREKMKETFNVDLDKAAIRKFINMVEKEVPEVIREHKFNKNKKVVIVPIGIWAVLLRSAAGKLGLSESKEIMTKGKVSLTKVLKSVVEENIHFFELFADDSEDDDHSIIVVGPNGEKIQIAIGKDFQDLDEYPEPGPLVFADIDEIPEKLKQDVIGQDDAISRVVDSLSVPFAGINDKNKPLRSFLFLGPTGVGKTQLSKSLAKYTAETKMNLIRIDMSEYSQEHEVAKFFGAPPGYAGFERGGILTTKVLENPQSIVLLDEVEKAHPKIWDSFLQILDAGRMVDGQGKEVDFTETIIIMTSNLGVSEINKKSTGFMTTSEEELYAERQKNSENIIMKSLKKYFRPEMINRIDEIIIFNELTLETARLIVRKELAEVNERLEKIGFNFTEVNDKVVDKILEKAKISEYGAREIKRMIFSNVETPVSKEILRARKNKDDNGSKEILLQLSEDSESIQISVK